MRSDAASLSDKEYLRYGRQLMLAEVGKPVRRGSRISPC